MPTTRILQSTATISGWMASYAVTSQNQEPTLIGLPVALWVTVEIANDDGTLQQQAIRPYVITRHGHIGDYMALNPTMQFLCISPPTEDWIANARAAFDDFVRVRAAEATAATMAPLPTVSSNETKN